jgi:hypothetical protein
VARQRCWRIDWVLDLDIKGFFDNLDHALLMLAVRKHTDCRWIILYSARWLIAPAQLPDGTLVARKQGAPQGGVISPLLANLFWHYAFDDWMPRHYPSIPLARYADDIIGYCKSKRQALWLKTAMAASPGLPFIPYLTSSIARQRNGQCGDTRGCGVARGGQLTGSGASKANSLRGFLTGNWLRTLWPVDRSRMNREVHVRNCEGVGVKLPRATRLGIS